MHQARNLPATRSNVNDTPLLPPLSHASYAQPHIHHCYATSLVPHGWCTAIEVSGYGRSGERGRARGPLLKEEIGVQVGEDLHPRITTGGESLTRRRRRSSGRDARRARIPLIRQEGAGSAGGRSILMLVASSVGWG